MNWISCSERMPDKDGTYSVTVEKDDYWHIYDEPQRDVYKDCGFNVEKQLFYFDEYVEEPHHFGHGDTFRIYIQPDGHILKTGKPLAWMPSLEPYAQ